MEQTTVQADRGDNGSHAFKAPCQRRLLLLVDLLQVLLLPSSLTRGRERREYNGEESGILGGIWVFN